MLVSNQSAFVRHQMEVQAEEQAAEAQKEKKLRERSEQYSRQLEEELEGLKVRMQRSTSHPRNPLAALFLNL